MLPLTVLKHKRAKYRVMKTKDLEDLLAHEKRSLKLQKQSVGLTSTEQKIIMIEEELKNREINNNSTPLNIDF